MAEVKTYSVEVSRDGKFWLIRIPELGRSTQAGRYRDVRAVAGELVEIMTKLRIEQFGLQIQDQSLGGGQHQLANS